MEEMVQNVPGTFGVGEKDREHGGGREREVRISVPRLCRGSGTLDPRSLNDLVSSFMVAQRGTATWAMCHKCTGPKMGVLATCLVSQFATWLTVHLSLHQGSGGIDRMVPTS